MLQSIGHKHLIAIVIIYIVIVFTGAFVLNTNSSVSSDDHLLLGNFDQVYEDSLSFLDRFVFGDVLKSPVEDDSATKEKKIVKRSTTEVTVPRYMLDVYEFLSNRRHHVKFDTARSFHSSNYVSTSVLSAFKWEDRTLFPVIFNVSHFPQSEIVLFAQIRIQTLHGAILGHIDSQKIELYSSTPSSLIKLNSKYFTPTTESLLTMNVTSAFQKAMNSNEKQLHFQMSVPNELLSLISLDPGTVEGPQLLVLSKTAHKKEQSEDTILNRMRRSLKDAIPEFSKLVDSVQESGTSVDRNLNKTKDVSINSMKRRRQRRSEDEDEEAEEQSNYIVEELGRIRKGKLKRKKNPCRRKPLHVNFADINYDQWIIAPPTYEAFECTGRCSFPMSAHLAPTKHAIIQTLMHSLEPKQVSRACCVPIKLEPMSILYVEDDGTVTFKYDYEDMVVAECGCR